MRPLILAASSFLALALTAPAQEGADPAPFDRVELHSRAVLGDADYLPRDRANLRVETVVSVAARGAVEVRRRHVHRERPEVLTPVRDQATAAELERLTRAIDAAAVEERPSYAPGGYRDDGGPGASLRVITGGRTRVFLDSGDEWPARLAEVVEALQAIQGRLATGPFTAQVRGPCRFDGSRLLIRDADTDELYEVVDVETIQRLHLFDGLTVSVEGRAVPSVRWAYLAVSEVLDPRAPEEVTGVVTVEGGAPVLTTLEEPAARLSLHGPLTELLAPGADGPRKVTAKGFLFHEDGAPRAAYLTSLSAEANWFGQLSLSGAWVGMVRPGSDLEVLEVERDHVRVRRPGGRLAMLLPRDRIEVGEPVSPGDLRREEAPASRSGRGLADALESVGD